MEIKNCYLCYLEKNYHECNHLDMKQQSMLIVDGFMNVLGWEKYMTVKQRQEINDNLDSYIMGILVQLRFSSPPPSKKE